MKKKFITFMMVAVMVLGSTVSAFAANSPDTNNSVNTGGSNVVDPDDDEDDTLGDNTTTTPDSGSTSKPSGGTTDSGANKNPSGTTTNPDVEEDTADVKDGGVVSKEEAAAIQEVAKVEGSKETLVVAVVSKDSADYKVVTAAKELKDVKFTVIDLSFASKAQPKEGTKIILPIAKLAEIKDAKYVSVYAVKDAKLELVDVVKVDKDGNFSFEPKHFSTYVFAAATEAQYNANANAGGSVDSDGNTGDMAPIATMIVIAGLAAVCAVVVYKRKEA